MYHPRLKGSHYEMGKHYGDILFKSGQDLSSVIILSDDQIAFGKACLPIRSFKTLDFNECKEIISGKYGFVCQFEKSLHFDTIWSAVYNLNSLYNEICEGNPSKKAFKYDNRLDWGMKKN